MANRQGRLTVMIPISRSRSSDPAEGRKAAYRWAIRALGRRMHSENEIRLGLIKREFSDDVISGVIARLKDQSYIDDLEFATQLILARGRSRGYGRIRIHHELRRKGVDTELSRKALDAAMPPEREGEIAIRTAEKKLVKIRKQGFDRKAALYRFLETRGFTLQSIWTALDAVNCEEEQD